MSTGAKWSRREEARLRKLYPHHSQRQVAAALGRTKKAIASRAKLLKIRRLRKYRPWAAAEIALLRRRYPDQVTKKIAAALGRPLYLVYQKARKLGVVKTEEYLASPDACRLRRGDNPGIPYRFKPGQIPANKGLRRPGWAPGRMAETQFKKGQRSGAAARNWMPVGSTRLSKDGYLQRKVTETGYPPRDWVGEHILLWVKEHGPVPPGHAVLFRDGNRRNIAIENLELITRSELMRRNSIHRRLSPELKAAVMTLGRLKRVIRERTEHGEEQDRGSTQPSV